MTTASARHDRIAAAERHLCEGEARLEEAVAEPARRDPAGAEPGGRRGWFRVGVR